MASGTWAAIPCSISWRPRRSDWWRKGESGGSTGATSSGATSRVDIEPGHVSKSGGVLLELGDAHDGRRPRAVLLPHVEGGLPDHDHSVAHPPCLEPAPGHRLAGVAIFPGAFPEIGQHVSIEREQGLLQPVTLLP